MEKYTITIEKQKEGGFVATVAELPGCVTQGETIAYVLYNLGEAISGWEV